MCREQVLKAQLRATPQLARLLEPREVTPREPCPRCSGRGRTARGNCCPTCGGDGIVGELDDARERVFALDGRGRARSIELRDRADGDALHRAHAPACAERCQTAIAAEAA